MIINTALFIIFTTIACSWGWGMRGTAIGGEKGAMLPGALLGTSAAVYLSMLTGNPFFRDNFFLFSAVGAVSMYCGGCMTYGETFWFSMGADPAPNMKKGMAAVFIKGGAWFSVCYGTISMYVSLLAGKYDIYDIILLFALLPVFTISGLLIFNRPHDPAKNKFPKIYFSTSRKESWGQMVGITLTLLVVSGINTDWLTFIMTLCGIVFGGFGWMAAQMMQVRMKFPAKNGKYFLDKFVRKKSVESWKTMECALGAIGGLGFAVSASVLFPIFCKTPSITSDGFNFIGEDVSKWLGLAYFAIILIDTVQYFIGRRRTKKDLDEMLKLTLMSREEYEREIKNAADSESPALTKYRQLCEYCEFPLYSTLPLILIMLGSVHTASFVSFGVIFLVLSQEISSKLFKHFSDLHRWEAVMYSVPVIISALQFITGFRPGLFLTMIVYTIIYEGICIVRRLWDFRLQKDNDGLFRFLGSQVSVHSYFIACCMILMVFSIFI